MAFQLVLSMKWPVKGKAVPARQKLAKIRVVFSYPPHWYTFFFDFRFSDGELVLAPWTSQVPHAAISVKPLSLGRFQVRDDNCHAIVRHVWARRVVEETCSVDHAQRLAHAVQTTQQGRTP